MTDKNLAAVLGLGTDALQVARLASVSGHALLTEGTVSPDQRLLDLCEMALYHLITHTRMLQDRPGEAEMLATADAANWNIVQRGRAIRELHHQYCESLCAAKPLLREAAKLKATTGPGIYAKAMLVRASRTGAAALALSLAEDLLACEPLRQTLWEASGTAGEG